MNIRPALNHPLERHPRDRQLQFAEFRDSVLRGLGGTPKSLPCKFFYDAEGARLFERICTLPEYYPTRMELALLEKHAADLAALAGPGARLVEFGSGAGEKVRRLLREMERPAAYMPIDISRDQLLQVASALSADFPDLAVMPVCADFTQPLVLPAPGDGGMEEGGGRAVGFFPGSTIGNFTPQEAERFLRRAAGILGPGSLMIVGVDTPKDRDILESAYDDAAGVTAAFNLNLLRRINRELGADFDIAGFRHEAHWNSDMERIEMHLVAQSGQVVQIAGRVFDFLPGERIHTENSHKYDPASFILLAESAGFKSAGVLSDPGRTFTVHVLEAMPRH